jgi:hypothetical protein
MDNKIIKEKQDLTYLNWSRIRASSGTAGSFLKSYSDLGGKKIYYKLSNFDSYKGVIGHECVNEIIVDRLLTILGIEHLNYRLIHADIDINGSIYDTWVCASDDFKNKGDKKLALDAYYQLEKLANERPLDFCIRMGWENYIYQMLIVDFLILNRDRHGANIEVLKNTLSGQLRLAPLFDNGLSLIFNCYSEDEIDKVNVMEDKPVQCFVGSKSAFDNLKLIPTDLIPVLNPLKESDKELLFADLNSIISLKYQDKIWEMIWTRWKYYEGFCNQR